VVPVRCGNWFGWEGRHEPSNDPDNPSGAPLEQYVGNVFWNPSGRTIQQTMTEIKAQGLTTLRIPVAPQTLESNPPNQQGLPTFPNGKMILKNDPSVRQQNAWQGLTSFIQLANTNNIQLVLDIHSCSNYVGWRKGRLDARPPYVDATRQSYDFKRENYSCSSTGNPAGFSGTINEYNQTKWLADLRTLAGLPAALGVTNIMGIDIFNEPWDYSWSQWKSLAESAYSAINGVNPNLLIFVEGISASSGNQDGTPDTKVVTPHGSLETNPNWGENLYEAGSTPLTIPMDRLVYSPHTYGPSVFQQAHFMDPAQTNCIGLEGEEAGDADCNLVITASRLTPGWEEHFGYLKDSGYAMVVGEFGGNWDWPNKASTADRARWAHITPGVVDGQWQTAFVNYMKSRGIEACYWGMNPESGDTYGWYATSYDPVSATSNWGTWTGFDSRKTPLLKSLWGL
jgi:aryl-phospho-beta-D-glucosidase BglC (GH1 family)